MGDVDLGMQIAVEITPLIVEIKAVPVGNSVPDKDSDRAAVSGNSGDVVLGFASFWPDHDA